ncbi:MAG: 16S rRNA (cytosine(967)-C(5))-methyltransferase RsmB [Oscillospiraceae bacterium]|nr:16S rRNA (cytosine(967)-C(5))-methyltransferase RsmB [Oscillospiraceae bacterium]
MIDQKDKHAKGAPSARDAAHAALREYRRGMPLRDAVDRRLLPLTDARERALAKQIIYGVARNTALCDYYIAAASSSPLSRLEPPALDILRAAVYQLAFLDKIPPSAAVNEAVSAARRRLNPRAAGFINAVLRRLADGGLPEINAETEPERLSILYSHPLWLVRELISRLGEADAALELRANNSEPAVFARVNTLKITAAELQRELREYGIGARRAIIPDTLELRGAGDITALPAFRAGKFFVQDPSSTRAALALNAQPGDTVIDACAAPGGKSFALALAMRGRGRIISCDTPGRIDLIESGARRLGIDIIEARAADAAIPDASLFELADAVLADVPCSGFGVIRKKPEIRFKTEADTARLPELQLGILSNCASYVKRGGTLVYSTCTFPRRENEDVAAEFLRRRGAEFELQSEASLYAHRDGGDGFYYAVFKRRGA